MRDTRSKWKSDGTGVLSGGDVGGDVQASNSYSVRFVPDGPQPNENGHYALVTEYWYAVDEWSGDRAKWAKDIEPQGDEDEIERQWQRRFGVQCQIEFMLCTDITDPGGTEVWADYDYYEDALFYTLEAATAEASSRADSSEKQDGWDIMWDGVSQK